MSRVFLGIPEVKKEIESCEPPASFSELNEIHGVLQASTSTLGKVHGEPEGDGNFIEAQKQQTQLPMDEENGTFQFSQVR